MTSSEVKSSSNATYAVPKKMGNETVNRKTSFKCASPSKAASQKVSRKVVLPISSVKALTFKFNELSQISDEQKHRISQTAVKSILTANGKSSTIKVVICRKPSASKYRRSDDGLIRKKNNLRRLQTSNPSGLEESKNSSRNVHKKVSEFEEKEKAEVDTKNGLNLNKARTKKMQVPKVLVDIDLSGENCLVSHKNPQNESESTESKIEREENSLSVKTAINLFEQNSKISTSPDKNLNGREKISTLKRSSDTLNSNNDTNKGEKTEIVPEIKTKPIAAIKPILKKTEDKSTRRTKLLPKDSLNRKKYVLMKRELTKSNEAIDNAEKDSQSNSEKENWDEEKKDVEEDSERFQVSESAKESEGKLKNESSLHKQLRQSSFSVLINEIPLQEEESSIIKVDPVPETPIQNPNTSLKPNTSFLWSKKEELYAEKRAVNRIDLPLPIPPKDYIPNIIDNENETVYDDVLVKSEDSEREEFEKMSDSDAEETYDDVGTENNFFEKEVREKNLFNKMSGADAEALYDHPENCMYLYDDGEGEKYQYISEVSESIYEVSKETELEVYQYIQNDDDGANIYEDIQSIKCHLTKCDRVKDTYEDIACQVDSGADNGLVSNCYESVYNGIYSSDNGTQGYVKSDVSDTSNNSGRSSYEKNNSLYGIPAGNPIGSDHLLSTRNENESTENLDYHITMYGSACPNSETSQSNSDEWVEVSESESELEGTVYLVHERPRKTKAGGNSSFQKEKRRWKNLQRKTNMNLYADEVKLQTSDDHLYESVGQYENAEMIQEVVRNLEAEQTNNNNSKDQFYNDDQFIDDFDSQSSEDEAFVDAKLPDIPNHGYNITKSLKAAGKKLRKNFSLRKSDFSKSLKRFKKSSRTKEPEVTLGNGKEVDVDSSQKSESPSTPTNLNNSIYSNNSDSSSSSHNVMKTSNSVNDLKNQRHRKSWTFRNKFKSTSLESAENGTNLDNNRNSKFYFTLEEVQPKKIEKKSELLNEIQSVLSKRNSYSCESVTEKLEKDALRSSDIVGSTSAKIRPSVPPPPPPNKVEVASEKTKYSDILWGEKATNNCLYVESGLFDKQKKHSRCTDSDTSLYAEIGLYAASDEFNSKKTQMFVDEPLYQFYTECVNQRARDDILNNYDSEGYEEINDYYSVINEKRRTIDIKNVRPNFEDFNEDARSKISSIRSISDRRTLWCQIPAVVDSCILQTLSDQARKLQEAKFEIITSEGSYMNSLNVLESHFMKKVSDLNIITKRDFRILFSNIVSVKKCSESFLEDLENCWQDNIMLNGICDIVYKHSTTSFQVYTKYCKNQVCIYRTLRELLDKNWNFENALKEIESDPICQNLNIHSFLMLPMQRITRLPLLMGAVLTRMDKSDDEYEICKASFDVLNKIVQDCDDEARRMEKCEEMLILSQQIEFPKDIRGIPIITGSRFLVKSGQVIQLVNRDENKLTFGKKFSKVPLTLFLFTDLLIVAKKKNSRNYVVVDHCPRNLVQMQTTEGLTQLPVKLNTNSDVSGKLLMLLTMLENHEKKTVEMILSFEMESDKQRWLEAVTPKLSENPNECIYEEWDCPQVIALYEFTPVQPDELNLCIGDVVNVLKKMSDGWYQGERLRDGARGWFPKNHTQEVSSSHVRAKNKKLRYKLLALSGNLIDSQKTNGK